MTAYNYKRRLGKLIQETRNLRKMTQADLAETLSTSQSAINRIEKGGQNISIEMLAKISEVLSSNLMLLNHDGKTNFKIHGGKNLSGTIDVK